MRLRAAAAAAAAEIGANAGASSLEGAGRDRDIVILATPWMVTLDIVRYVAPMITGKSLWDASGCRAGQ